MGHLARKGFSLAYFETAYHNVLLDQSSSGNLRPFEDFLRPKLSQFKTPLLLHFNFLCAFHCCFKAFSVCGNQHF